MCGRFTLRTPLTVLAQQFLFDLGTAGISPAEFLPRYNVAPTQTTPVVRRLPGGPRRELAFLHWGLVPSWSKDTKRAASAINARAETLAEKPMFRTAFARRRCLVLADGYFEWKAVGKKKQPYYFRMKDERPFAFAGLWETWRGTAGSADSPLESCTVVTTAGNALSAEIHDRMPVILSPDDYDAWLDPATTDRNELLAMLRPFPADEMKLEPVNPRVNSVRNDDAECIAPLTEEDSTFG
jgi:putative SOS response-associated peptidase YedK